MKWRCIRNFGDLYLKVEKRLNVQDALKIYVEKIIVPQDSKLHPINIAKLKKYYMFSLCGAYYEMRYLNLLEIFTIKISYYLSILRIIVKLFLLGKNIIIRIHAQDSGDKTYLTYTRSVKRAKSTVFPDKSLYEIPWSKQSIKINIKDKLRTLLQMLRHKTGRADLCYQYLKLEDDCKKYYTNSKPLVIEEGGDIIARMLMYIFSINGSTTIFTSSSPSTLPFPRFHVDKIITNNKLSYENLRERNKDVEIISSPIFVDKNRLSYPKVRYVGYLHNLGSNLINKYDVQKYDYSVARCLSKLLQRVFISIHPQADYKEERDVYYKYFRDCDVRIKSKSDSDEEYLSYLDVLIGWESTMIYQAIYAGIPVILLDYFEDNQHSGLEHICSGGLVKRVRNEQELYSAIKKSISMSKERKECYSEELAKCIFY